MQNNAGAFERVVLVIRPASPRARDIGRPFGEAEQLTRKPIEMALAGDSTAMRLCFDRILPPRRERPIALTLPALKSADDAAGAMAGITAAVASGEITGGEAGELSKLVQAFVAALEARDFERRLQTLEARDNATRS